MEADAIRTRRWTRAEYDHLIDIGVFRPEERLELLGGDLVVREPQNSAHYTAIGLAEDALRAVLPQGWLVRSQGPIEPDVTVAPGDRRSYSRHPARSALVVEVAESRLAFDRDHKGSLYARSGLADYWIVNLVDRVLEVYRRPVPDPAASFGWRYASKDMLRAGSSVELLAVPGARVLVRDLLP